MARPPNPNLEDRILEAARKLWKKGGDQALSMRAVARAARTNTPAVYRRFRSRNDILRSLLLQTRQQVFQELQAGSSVEDALERYLEFAVTHPHEYQLYFLKEYELFYSDQPKRGATLKLDLKRKRPTVEFMKGRMAAELGGAPDDYTRLTLSLWALLHGTATLLIANTVIPEHAEEMREACRASIQTLLGEARRSRLKDSIQDSKR